MIRINRRSFVGGAVALAATLRLRPAFAAKKPDIVDVKGSDPAKMVAAALAALGGIKKFVRKGDYVVIKPNAGFANPPEWATTTHPETVAAVARACVGAKAKQVLIVEYPLAKGKKALDRSGISAAVAGISGVEVRVLGGARDFRKVKVKGGTELKEVEVAKVVLSADVLINLPAAKAHSDAGVSFGLKNAMGLIRDRAAFHTAMNLDKAIADLARVVKPDLTILDATRALLTNGPAGPGETSKPGRLIAGRDIVAVDAYGLTVARFNKRKMSPADARHIDYAGKAGLGNLNLGKLRVKKVNA
jgi:uncharacterized protein (DUF362 family)